MKITALQVHEAYQRAVWGESVRSIARRFGVTEGCLRFHFRKDVHPRKLRKLAFELHYVNLHIATLDAEVKREVEREVERMRAKAQKSKKQTQGGSP